MSYSGANRLILSGFSDKITGLTFGSAATHSHKRKLSKREKRLRKKFILAARTKSHSQHAGKRVSGVPTTPRPQISNRETTTMPIDKDQAERAAHPADRRGPLPRSGPARMEGEVQTHPGPDTLTTSCGSPHADVTGKDRSPTAAHSSRTPSQTSPAQGSRQPEPLRVAGMVEPFTAPRCGQ